MGKSIYICLDMKLKFLLLAKVNKQRPREHKVIYLRVRDGVKHDWKVRTPFVVDPSVWDARKEVATIKPIMSEEDRNLWALLNTKLTNLRNYITQQYATDKLDDAVGDNWLVDTLAKYFAKPTEVSFQDIAEEFLRKHELADSRKKQYQVLFRSLQRYEIYVRLTRPGESIFKLELNKIDGNTLDELWNYMKDEATIIEKYPKLSDAVPTHKKADVRSTNTLVGIFKRLRAFFSWCVDAGYMDKNPFSEYQLETELYGTPIYITTAEVKKLYETDLSDSPKIEQQRDIFVFQCNVGCRVGDLMTFKKKDVVKNVLSYIPAKTIKENARTVSVPLNKLAREIVKKYKHIPGDQLLPFIRPQDYNDAIKVAFQRAKITRQVVILDPVTRTEKKVSIASIASSHMARRTFTGNLYRKVKDPNLVGSLTGHVEGSRAFARYRAIDDEMKNELVNLLVK